MCTNSLFSILSRKKENLELVFILACPYECYPMYFFFQTEHLLMHTFWGNVNDKRIAHAHCFSSSEQKGCVRTMLFENVAHFGEDYYNFRKLGWTLWNIFVCVWVDWASPFLIDKKNGRKDHPLWRILSLVIVFIGIDLIIFQPLIASHNLPVFLPIHICTGLTLSKVHHHLNSNTNM